MPRYFIELSYKGTRYAGFQKQQNANSIQAEVEKALSIYFRQDMELTGSSRTDAGVHAYQNFFHVDADLVSEQLAAAPYHLNAILPPDICIKEIKQVADNAHCRFDAQYRRYEYRIYRSKNVFLQETAYFFPYKLDRSILDACAAELKQHDNFEAFSKRNSQVFTYNCNIMESFWQDSGGQLIYTVQANRFLRGMVKGLVGTMLKMSTRGAGLDQFRAIINRRDSSRADFTPASQGLYLVEVGFPQ
jgi:tRNA pseudouridine38-40 synthase